MKLDMRMKYLTPLKFCLECGKNNVSSRLRPYCWLTTRPRRQSRPTYWSLIASELE